MFTSLRAATCLLLAGLILGCSTPPAGSVPAAQLLPGGPALGGKLLFVKDGNVWTWADGRARQITTGGTWRQPQWSPDGSEIAYVYRSANFSEIFVMSADGASSHRLTSSQSSSLGDNDWVFWPTWSPDGSRIAFVSDSSTYSPTLWLMNKDGSGKRQLLAPSALQEAADALSWSPDGKYLAVTGFGHEVSQVVLLDVGRGAPQVLTSTAKGAFDPAWSRDGAFLAYSAREAGGVNVHIRRIDSGAETALSVGGLSRSPAWSPDGRHLAYLSARGGTFEAYVADVALEGDRISVQNERQLTRDLNIDATSGLSWGK